MDHSSTYSPRDRTDILDVLADLAFREAYSHLSDTWQHPGADPRRACELARESGQAVRCALDLAAASLAEDRESGEVAAEMLERRELRRELREDAWLRLSAMLEHNHIVACVPWAALEVEREVEAAETAKAAEAYLSAAPPSPPPESP